MPPNTLQQLMSNEQLQPLPRYDEAFYLYSFKIVPCSNTLSHNWSLCPFVHSKEKARRRWDAAGYSGLFTAVRIHPVMLPFGTGHDAAKILFETICSADCSLMCTCRDPRLYSYQPLPCPEDRKGTNCPRGDQCPYTHNVYEYWLVSQQFGGVIT